MRRPILALLLFLCLGPGPWAVHRHQKEVLDERVAVRALHVAPGRSGPMRLVRAWRIESPHSRVGGFSAMARLGPGQFQFVGDNGYGVRLAIEPDGQARGLRIAALPQVAGAPRLKSMADVEAMAIDRATGKVWIALENINQIWRLDAEMIRIEARFRPGAMRDWSKLRGPEAMSWLPDGRLLVFAEGGNDDPRDNHGLLYAAAPGSAKTPPIRFYYDAEGKGAISDAATLPDGRALLVHRQLGWDPLFTSRVSIADPAAIRPGAVLRSRTIGTVPAALSDNFEGAAVAVEDGRTFLWLVSDHNFNRWQRSLLLQFELVDLPPPAPDSKKAARQVPAALKRP